MGLAVAGVSVGSAVELGTRVAVSGRRVLVGVALSRGAAVASKLAGLGVTGSGVGVTVGARKLAGSKVGVPSTTSVAVARAGVAVLVGVAGGGVVGDGAGGGVGEDVLVSTGAVVKVKRGAMAGGEVGLGGVVAVGGTAPGV